MEILKGQALKQLHDDAIIKRVLEGEKELYEILLRRYNQTLYRAIRSYINDSMEVEDVMQNTYLQAYEKLHQYRGDAAFPTWLIRVGINQALMQLRKRKKQRQLFAASADEEQFNNIISLSDHKMMNPEKRIILDETKRLVERAIDQLPEKYRAVYVLREIEGINNQEVALCLDLSESNVKVRLHRAKSLLKETLYKLTLTSDIYEFGNIRCDRLVERVMSLI